MSCPVGQTLEGSLCYAPCPDGFTVSPQDNSICQSSTLCADLGNLVQNPTDPYLCDKQGGYPGPPCSAPQILQGTTCQDVCPPSMIDNTSSCLKRLFTRIGVVPICGANQVWNGNECTSISGSSGGSAPQYFQVILLAILVSFFVLYASTFVFEGPTHTIGPQLGRQTVNTLVGHY